MQGTRFFASRDAALDAYRAHVSRGKVDFFRAVGMDVVMGRREGAYFWDVDGRRFLNAHCNGGVFNMGHRHPALVETLREALEYWDIGNHHLLSEARAALGARLAELLPRDLNRVVFAVGGGEAIDTAIKMARGLTGRTGIVSAQGGYHGHTGLALAAGDPSYRDPFGPQLPGFSQVPFGDLDALAAAIGTDTAAVILEAVPATLGIAVPEPDYMPAVRALCDERDALLILDEVQTGLGRTGCFFAAEHWDLVPDFVVLGKGLSGGLMPIAATCYREQHDWIFHSDPFVHVSTFGGAELACAVSLRLLDLITKEGFLEEVGARGDQLGRDLEAVRALSPDDIRDIPRLGMMAGIRFATPEMGMLACKALFDGGVFAVYANNDKRVVQFLLPLVSTPDIITEAADAVAAAIEKLRTEEYRALLDALEGNL